MQWIWLGPLLILLLLHRLAIKPVLYQEQDGNWFTPIFHELWAPIKALLARGIAASFKLMHKTHAYDWLLFVVRSSQVQWWWCSERSKVYFRLLGKMIEPFFSKNKKSVVQVNLCQKHLFLHQLTHNLMTDCSLNYEFSTWKLQAQNMLRTCCVHKLVFVLTFRTIYVHTMFSTCRQNMSSTLSWQFSCTELVI